MGAFHNLGQALRWIRSRQNRKQYEIATEAGITKAMLSAYETGKQNPSIETLEKILGALRVDVSDLHHALVLHQSAEGEAGDAAVAAEVWRSFDRERAGIAEPRVNLYHILGLEQRLPAEQERALSQTLAGFHSLLRAMYDDFERRTRPSQRPLGPRRLEDVEPGGDEGDEG